jgi:hypothetical protein
MSSISPGKRSTGGMTFSFAPVKKLKYFDALSVSSAITKVVPGPATLIISLMAFPLSGKRFIAPRWETTSNLLSLKGSAAASDLNRSTFTPHFLYFLYNGASFVSGYQYHIILGL